MHNPSLGRADNLPPKTTANSIYLLDVERLEEASHSSVFPMGSNPLRAGTKSQVEIKRQDALF